MPTHGRDADADALDAPLARVYVGLFDAHSCQNIGEARVIALRAAKLIRHRGPDWSGVHTWWDDKRLAVIAHERLAIVDPESGAQPLKNKSKSIVLAANGEIYNHLDLRRGPCKDYEFQTHSDCEVIIPLFEKYGHSTESVSHLDGMFAYILWDERDKSCGFFSSSGFLDG